MASDPPCFELQPTTRFDDRASDYARYRPSYPPEAIDAVFAGWTDPARLIVADVGAGTGISSRLLAERGPRVLAVEPNAAMRDAAEPHPRVTFIDASAEATGLESASVDIVVCAQAFHWFRPQEALAEFFRVLRSPGRLALIVNERDARDPVMREYNEAVRRASDRELSEEMRPSVERALAGAGLSATLREFAHFQPLSRESLPGRARSASYVPKEGPRHDQMVLDLDALWARRHDDSGLVHLGYRASVFLVDRSFA